MHFIAGRRDLNSYAQKRIAKRLSCELWEIGDQNY